MMIIFFLVFLKCAAGNYCSISKSGHWRRCSIKKIFLKILQNLQENTCTRVSFLIKLQDFRLRHRCFPITFAKFSRTPFLWNTLWQLLQSKCGKIQTRNFTLTQYINRVALNKCWLRRLRYFCVAFQKFFC